MPDVSWRRPRRKAAHAQRARAKAAPSTPPPPAIQPRYLYRAADCYRRAGEPLEAAGCLRLLGDYEQSAQLYLDSGSYEQAALAYLEDGQHEVAAWIYAHDLGRPEVARGLLQLAEQGVARAAVSRANEVAGADRLTSWHGQVGVIRDRISGVAPGSDPGSVAAAVRRRIAGLAAELIGDSGGHRDLAPFLVEIRQLKQAAISGDDWPAGYCARELERLISDEREARQTDRHAAGQRQLRDVPRGLGQRLVLARCAVAEGLRPDRILPALTQTQEVLADPRVLDVHKAEAWGVAIAEVIHRYDQAALIFAAAVRGRRPGAAERWRAWSARVLKVNLVVPADAERG